MPKGGRREGSGRKKGVATKKTEEVRNRAAAEGITPLEVMIKIMRERNVRGDEPGTLEAANMAAPYMHPRLSAQQLEHSGSVASGGIDRPPPPAWLGPATARLDLSLAPQQEASFSLTIGCERQPATLS